MTKLNDNDNIPELKKDTFYFSHDCNARNDLKIIKMLRELGPAAYGIFWMVIEILREQHDYRLPVSAISDISFNLHIEEKILTAVIFNYNLFEIANEIFFSKRLLRSMDELNARRHKLSEAGRKGNKIKYNNADSTNFSHGDNDDIATRSQGDRNPIALKESKVKESKVKESIISLSVSTETANTQKLLKEKFSDLTKSLNGQDVATCWNGIKDFIETEKPCFAEPFVEAWNLFAGKYNLPEIKKITEKRRKKFLVRLTEKDFDFYAILDKIKTSAFLKGTTGNDWKATIDWILENEENYTKVLENNFQ